MFSFVDISGDLSASKNVGYVVAASASIQRSKVARVINNFYKLKKDILDNETIEIKSTEFTNKHTLENPALNKYKFIEKFMNEIIPEFCFSAVIMKNVPEKKIFRKDKLPDYYIFLLQRINGLAEYLKRHALVIIDNQDRKIDKDIAHNFNNFLFRSNKGSELSKIVEMPLFADSKMTPGIQVADVAAGVIRVYYEKQLTQCGASSDFEVKIQEYYKVLDKHSAIHSKHQSFYVTPPDFVSTHFCQRHSDS